jgi:hypothetical protein
MRNGGEEEGRVVHACHISTSFGSSIKELQSIAYSVHGSQVREGWAGIVRDAYLDGRCRTSGSCQR